MSCNYRVSSAADDQSSVASTLSAAAVYRHKSSSCQMQIATKVLLLLTPLVSNTGTLRAFTLDSYLHATQLEYQECLSRCQQQATHKLDMMKLADNFP